MNLINLILIIVVVGVAAYMIINFIKKRKAEEAEDQIKVDDST